MQSILEAFVDIEHIKDRSVVRLLITAMIIIRNFLKYFVNISDYLG